MSELVGGPDGPLISVVDSGGVLVMVSVVVGRVVVDETGSAAVAENDGSTMSAGAVGESSCRVMNMMAAMRTPMTAMPMALAPTTARVELCQGSKGSSSPNSSTNSSLPNSSSRSGPATDTDINPGTCGNAASAQLRDHFGGEQLEVIQVGHIQKLQVDPLDAAFDERCEAVDDLAGRARKR